MGELLDVMMRINFFFFLMMRRPPCAILILTLFPYTTLFRSTPGTNLNMQALEESKNNYLMCITFTTNKIGISTADITTGDFYTTEVEDMRKLLDEIMKFQPTEIICNDAFLVSGIDLVDLRERLHIVISTIDAYFFDDNASTQCILRHFKINTLIGLGLEDFPTGTIDRKRVV